MHVALEELHEPSLPWHRKGVLDEVHTTHKVPFSFSPNASTMMSKQAHTTLSALGRFRMPMVFAGEYSVQGGEAHTIVNHPIG